MSSFAWMRVLESSAERYDRGMALLSRGRIGSLYRRVASAAVPAVAGTRGAAAGGRRPRVMDIGCGTGGVTLACAGLGADAVGIDRNAEMLEVAEAKPLPEGATGSVTWLELGAAEIEDRFPAASFDAVVACLALGEMSEDERDYTLRTALTRLVPGGRLVLADEVEPPGRARRLLRRLATAPVQAIVYLLTQVRTRPVPDLPALVAAAGFVEVRQERLWGGAFAVVSARAPSLDAGRARRDAPTADELPEGVA